MSEKKSVFWDDIVGDVGEDDAAKGNKNPADAAAGGAATGTVGGTGPPADSKPEHDSADKSAAVNQESMDVDVEQEDKADTENIPPKEEDQLKPEGLEADIVEKEPEKKTAGRNVAKRTAGKPKEEEVPPQQEEDECSTSDTGSEESSDVSERDGEDEEARKIRKKHKRADKLTKYWNDKAASHLEKHAGATSDKMPAGMKQKILDSFVQDSYKIELTGIEDHKYTKYMTTLLRKGETTVLETGSQEENDMDDFFVPAILMIELIKSGRYTRYKDDENEIVLMPFSYADIRAADRAVRELPCNANKADFNKRFSYVPVNHDLPLLDIQPGEYDFKNWRPELPTQEDFRVFKYAPSNIRCDGSTWAANCRHRVADWDEHPWCGFCMAAAHITQCGEQDLCYLCARMEPRSRKLYKQRVRAWTKSEKLADFDKNVKLLDQLRAEVKTQIHANYLTVIKDKNPFLQSDTSKKYLGFCRPSWLVPIYWSSAEVKRIPADMYKPHIDEQNQAYEREYEWLRAGREDNIWSDLETARIEQREHGSVQKRLRARAARRGFTECSSGEEDATKPEESPSARALSLSKKEVRKKATARRGVQTPPVTTPKQSKTPRVKLQFKAKKEKKKPAPEGAAGSYTSDDHQDEPDPATPQQMNLQMPGAVVPTLAAWVHFEWRGSMPKSRIDREFDYAAVTESAIAIRPVETKQQKTLEFKGDEAMFSYKRRRRNRQYEPNIRYHELVNAKLKCYVQNCMSPDFPREIPIDLAQFPEGRVRSTPQLPTPDAAQKLPEEADTVEISQKEIIRLEAVIRALLKVHENDCMAVTTMQIYINELEDKLADEQEGPYVESNQSKVMAAVSKNCATREDLLAEALAVTLAVRRRDNALRIDVTPNVLNQIVSADLYKVVAECPIEEESQLIDI